MVDRDPIIEYKRYKRGAEMLRGSMLFRLAGTLTGAGLGFLVEKSAQSAALGAATGGAVAYGVEKLVGVIMHQFIYNHVNK